MKLADEVSTIIPKCRGSGVWALHADGVLVIGGRNSAHFKLSERKTTSILVYAGIGDVVGFSDFITDAKSGIYVGTIAHRLLTEELPKPGDLLFIYLDGSYRIVSDGVMLSNRVAESPNGQPLYHSDSFERHVRCYEVAADGSLSSPEALV